MLDTELMSVVAILFEERSILSPTSISFRYKKSGRVPAFTMVTSLPYTRSMYILLLIPSSWRFRLWKPRPLRFVTSMEFQTVPAISLGVGTTTHDLCSNRPTTLLFIWRSLSLYCQRLHSCDGQLNAGFQHPMSCIGSIISKCIKIQQK